MAQQLVKKFAKVRSDCVINSPAAVPFRAPVIFSGAGTATPPRSAIAQSTSTDTDAGTGTDTQASQQPMFIGIGGGRGSGKEHTCRNIIDKVRQRGHTDLASRVVHLHLDDFHHELSAADQALQAESREQINFDHPESFDWDLLQSVMAQLARGNAVQLPVWDRAEKRRTGWQTVEPRPRVVLVEGILVLFVREVRAFMDMMVFLDVDSDTRLGRQVREVMRGPQAAELKAFLDHYLYVAKPSFEEFVWPTKRWADVIIPRGDCNAVAIELIAQRLIDLGQEA
ncbi:hypothetical protein LPJ66_010797 [Kickxella alabastrina]|uniref:Uncharacterized protein n=1 Tax=Kickxella alabastrina TaxID=61397 RepID=A0ACC1HZI6_9FUNG|nr:hypothetical protein LPJ66_010797 [Kickxella alabastrina]